MVDTDLKEFSDLQMSGETLGVKLGWYAIHCHPKQEERAKANLMAWQVEAFSPRVKKARLNPYTRAPVYESKPFFPRYIFARFDVNSMLRNVLFTRGVHSVVSFGGVPAQIDDEIITLIKSQVAEDGFIKFGDQLRVGDRVVIENGPLRSLVGIFNQEIKGTDRVLILLSAISYQGSVVIERDHVRRVTSHETWVS